MGLSTHINSFKNRDGAEVLCKTICRIQKIWGLNQAEISRLLHATPQTYGNWIKSKKIPLSNPYSPENEVVIAFIAIYRSLGAMFQSPRDQILWLQSPHPQFDNQSPIQFAQQSSENVFGLRSYLDYVRGRGA